MKKINRPLNIFPIDILLLSPDICQRVTSKYFKISVLKIEKNEKTERTVQFVGNGVFENLSIGNNKKGRFEVSGETTPVRKRTTPP